MISIGDFARLGRVSVRQLRHYDAMGLLRPARVDPWTGYRSYDADQLQRLNRLLTLKDLGLSLDEVRQILDQELTGSALAALLRHRHEALAAQIQADTARLHRVAARLRLIERESTMSQTTIEIKHVPALRLAVVRGRAPEIDSAEISPVIQHGFATLGQAMADHRDLVVGPPVAYYEDLPDGAGLECCAGLPVRADAELPDGVEALDLPAVERMATYLHVGAMDSISAAYQELGTGIAQAGDRPDNTSREVYIDCDAPDQAQWITEIQMPLVDR